MRTFQLIAALALLSCATAPSPKPTPEPLPAPKLEAEGLPIRPLATPAPLTTVLLPVKDRPIVSFRLVFRAGSVDDPAGKEGLTYLTAQLMAEGGTEKLSAAELAEALFPMAAELEVSTGKELTVFSGRVHQDRLERFFEIFSDVLLSPRLAASELERLRADTLNTVKNHLRSENDELLGKIALDELLYPGHPYRHFSAGTVKGLSAITLEDVKAQWKSVFTQDRAILGLAGAVDEVLAARVKARFLGLPAAGAPLVKLPPVPPVRARTLVLQKDTLSTAISMGYVYPLRRGDPDYYAVALALSYLGEHRQFHGVLFQELREKRGLNYGNYAYAEHFEQEGWGSYPKVNVARASQDFSIWIRPVEPQNAIFATRGALHYLEELTQHPPPADKLETARGFLIGYTRLWEQTDQRRLGYAIDEVLYKTPNFLEGYRKALAQLSPEQVQAAAARHLSPEKLNYVFVTKDAKGLAAKLASKAPSPISYPSPKPPEVLSADEQLANQALPLEPGAIEVREAAGFMEE